MHRFEGFSGYRYTQAKWTTRPTIAHAAKRGLLRIRRQGDELTLYFRPHGAAIWTPAGSPFLPLSHDKVYLGLSLGIQGGTAAGPMEAGGAAGA